MELASIVSKIYITPNRNIVSKQLLDAIHDQHTKGNLLIIKKKADIFGLLILGDDATISRCPLLNIWVLRRIPVAVLEIVHCQGHLDDGNKIYDSFICNQFCNI